MPPALGAPARARQELFPAKAAGNTRTTGKCQSHVPVSPRSCPASPRGTSPPTHSPGSLRTAALPPRCLSRLGLAWLGIPEPGPGGALGAPGLGVPSGAPRALPAPAEPCPEAAPGSRWDPPGSQRRCDNNSETPRDSPSAGAAAARSAHGRGSALPSPAQNC